MSLGSQHNERGHNEYYSVQSGSGHHFPKPIKDTDEASIIEQMPHLPKKQREEKIYDISRVHQVPSGLPTGKMALMRSQRELFAALKMQVSEHENVVNILQQSKCLNDCMEALALNSILWLQQNAQLVFLRVFGECSMSR